MVLEILQFNNAVFLAQKSLTNYLNAVFLALL